MISDTLRPLNVYQIPNDIIYLYCHTCKAPTTLASQNICLNHFAYLQYISNLPPDSRRHIYSGYSSNHSIVTIDQRLTFRVFVEKLVKYHRRIRKLLILRYISIFNRNISSIKTKKRKLIVESTSLFIKKSEKAYFS